MPLPDVDPRRLPLDHPALGPFAAGPLIRRLRQRVRVSQRELAWRARVAHTTVSRVESGDLAPSLALLQRLLAIGGLHVVVVDEQGGVILPLPDDDDEPRRRGYGAAHRVYNGRRGVKIGLAKLQVNNGMALLFQFLRAREDGEGAFAIQL